MRKISRSIATVHLWKPPENTDADHHSIIIDEVNANDKYYSLWIITEFT